MPLNPVDQTAPRASVFGHSTKGRRGYAAIKFLGSLRGKGTLTRPGRRGTPVTYQLDQYEGAAGRTGSGALEGPLGARTSPGDQARLRLEDGREIQVTLQETDDEGAVFETSGAFSAPGARKRA